MLTRIRVSASESLSVVTTRSGSALAFRRVWTAVLSTLIFVLLVIASFAGLTMALRALNINLHSQGDDEQPLSVVSTFLMIGIVVLVTFVLGRFQRRLVTDFGLRLTGSFQLALQGVATGLALCSALIGILIAVGAVTIHVVMQPLGLSCLYAIVWAVGFFAVGFMEETLFRGYPLIRLSEGIGFWPAAIVLSLVFGALHLGNEGETYVGSINAILLALVLCLSVRITGSLWWAIGFHCAWDWTESFLFGCSDSGIKIVGRISDVAPLPESLLSGGSAGPEGSFVALGAIALAAVLLLLSRSRLRAAAELSISA
jgi:membrane protease YdiL (CAAX protease family)